MHKYTGVVPSFFFFILFRESAQRDQRGKLDSCWCNDDNGILVVLWCGVVGGGGGILQGVNKQQYEKKKKR